MREKGTTWLLPSQAVQSRVSLTFESSLLGDVKRRVLPGQGILGIRAAWRPHFVEGRHTVAGLELEDVLAYLVDHARNVISLIVCRVPPLGPLPVLGVGAAHHDLDDDLIRTWFGDRRVHDLDLWSCDWIILARCIVSSFLRV